MNRLKRHLMEKSSVPNSGPNRKDPSNGRNRTPSAAASGSPDDGANSGSRALVPDTRTYSGVNPGEDPSAAAVRFQLEQRYAQHWNALAVARSKAEIEHYMRQVYVDPWTTISPQAYKPALQPKIEDAGIRVGEFEGWRAWHLQRGFLQSVYKNTLWIPGKEVSGRPDKPSEGVHAWKTLELCLEYGLSQSSVTVVGRVKLWGIVVEHEHGYRAEHVKITHFDYVLAEDPSFPEDLMLEKLRRRYAL